MSVASSSDPSYDHEHAHAQQIPLSEFHAEKWIRKRADNQPGKACAVLGINTGPSGQHGRRAPTLGLTYNRERAALRRKTAIWLDYSVLTSYVW